MNKQTLQVDEGVSVARCVFEPAGAARASVVIGGAFGVRQGYYASFAQWLAGQGFRVTTFDYRGHGDSLVGPMREVRADLFDWARDYEAVIAAARAAQPDLPLYLLGHSLGAQLPGLLRSVRLAWQSLATPLRPGCRPVLGLEGGTAAPPWFLASSRQRPA